MKQDNNNPPHVIPPHILKYWIKGTIKNGVIIKKKTKKENSEVVETKEDDDGIIILKIIMKRLHSVFVNIVNILNINKN